MNTLSLTAQSAWATLYSISDRAWAITGSTYSALTGSRAIALYRRIILGAIALAAIVYGCGVAARRGWEWVKLQCDDYLERCEDGDAQDEIADTIQAVVDTIPQIIARTAMAIVVAADRVWAIVHEVRAIRRNSEAIVRGLRNGDNTIRLSLVTGVTGLKLK